MAKTKIHWYRGCGFGKRSSQSMRYTPALFVQQKSINPDWYCWDCAKAARLVLAKESAPKPDTRTDSDRYAELRKLVEAWQSHQAGSSTALAEWNHR